MKIQQINNYQQTNFKSTYPVVHWVAEANGSYAPVSNLKIVKKLQSKIVRVLNKPLNESKKQMVLAEQNLRAYAGRCDIAYRNNPRVRSYYNRAEANMQGTSPVVYMITGKDIDAFEEVFAKNIGRAKKEGKEILETPYSPEAQAAIDIYNNEGLKFVDDAQKRIIDPKTGMTYALHTKFQIIRNKLGKIKDYKFVDARFLPEKGAANPLERLKG